MRIKKVKTIMTKVWKSVTIEHENKLIDISVQMLDGKVSGDFNSNMATSTLTYFDFPDAIREKHFQQIKKKLEK